MVPRTSRPGLTFPLEERYLTPKEAGDQLGISRRTLGRYRTRNSGPAFYKFGSKVRYKMEDLHAWAARRRIGKRRKREVPVATAED